MQTKKNGDASNVPQNDYSKDTVNKKNKALASLQIQLFPIALAKFCVHSFHYPHPLCCHH